MKPPGRVDDVVAGVVSRKSLYRVESRGSARDVTESVKVEYSMRKGCSPSSAYQPQICDQSGQGTRDTLRRPSAYEYNGFFSANIRRRPSVEPFLVSPLLKFDY